MDTLIFPNISVAVLRVLLTGIGTVGQETLVIRSLIIL